MDTVTIRELRNRGGEVVDRVASGDRVTITRDGRPVAVLGPIRSSALGSAALLRRWRRLAPVDPVRFRRDIDAVIDQSW